MFDGGHEFSQSQIFKNGIQEDLGAVSGVREGHGENIFRVRKTVFFWNKWFSTERL